MTQPPLTLRPLENSDESAFNKAVEDFKLVDPHFEFGVFYSEYEDFPSYVSDLSDWSKGKRLKAGHVPSTFLIALVEEEIVGRVSIRHELNDFLRTINGHIGYGVCPKFRKLGYAKEILRQSLIYCKGLGIDKVMLTCDDENIGSIKTIESQGGVLEERFIYEGKLKRRYWIST